MAPLSTPPDCALGIALSPACKRELSAVAMHCAGY